MKISKLMLAAAASCMSFAPAMAASANPAASLSVAKSVRTGSATAKDSKAAAGAGGIPAIFIAAGVIAIAVLGIVALTDDDDASDSN